jgi:hypothetical protein
VIIIQKNKKENKIFNVSQHSNPNYNDQQNITESENDERWLTNKIIEWLEGNLDFYKFWKKTVSKLSIKDVIVVMDQLTLKN